MKKDKILKIGIFTFILLLGFISQAEFRDFVTEKAISVTRKFPEKENPKEITLVCNYVDIVIPNHKIIKTIRKGEKESKKPGKRYDLIISRK